VIIGLIHYYYSLPYPLFLQLFTGPVTFYKASLLKVHIFGNVIPRPFPIPPSPFEKFSSLKKEIEQQIKPDEKKKKVKKLKKPSEKDIQEIKSRDKTKDNEDKPKSD